MLFGLVEMTFSNYFTSRTGSTTRGHNYKLFLNYSRLNVRKHFFSERIVAIWNNLEYNIVDFTNIIYHAPLGTRIGAKGLSSRHISLNSTGPFSV